MCSPASSQHFASREPRCRAHGETPRPVCSSQECGRFQTTALDSNHAKCRHETLCGLLCGTPTLHVAGSPRSVTSDEAVVLAVREWTVSASCCELSHDGARFRNPCAVSVTGTRTPMRTMSRAKDQGKELSKARTIAGRNGSGNSFSDVQRRKRFTCSI
jgi:hypothetical protein